MAPSSGGHLQGWQPSRIITIVLVLNSSSARVAPHREPWWGGCSKSSKKQRPWREHVPPLEESRWDILLVAEGYRWARGQGMSLYLLVDPAWNRWPWEAWPEGSRARARVCVVVRLSVTPRTTARQAPLSMGFSRQEYWGGLLFPSPRDLPDPGIEPGSPTLQADSLPSEPAEKPQVTNSKGSISCY